MERKQLEFVLDDNHYLKGGTKEACVIARNFLSHATSSGNEIYSHYTCVTADEFIDAVKKLIAYTFQQDDAIPKMWKCDNDCRMVSYLLCPGECNINKESDKTCPFFWDEGLI